ncbi:hypothetical protein HW555_005700 [Spodoptera exigua]|uniref:Uncharacterized protein n=1 Tax=Spodoptera exigua TaxID=7107 RepID=A0A835GHI3_SPOEX|nr:hypothetical protein HW555_005700 [Spodoptera exigua]
MNIHRFYLTTSTLDRILLSVLITMIYYVQNYVKLTIISEVDDEKRCLRLLLIAYAQHFSLSCGYNQNNGLKNKTLTDNIQNGNRGNTTEPKNSHSIACTRYMGDANLQHDMQPRSQLLVEYLHQ